MPVWIRLVVADVEFTTRRVQLVGAVTIPVRHLFGSFEVDHCRFYVGDRFALCWISHYPVCTTTPDGQGGAVDVVVEWIVSFEHKNAVRGYLVAKLLWYLSFFVVSVDGRWSVTV